MQEACFYLMLLRVILMDYRFERGEPTLSWSACQQNLYGAIGDVILILDCCHAALLAKGTKDAGRFEVLAASAKGVLTPEPGKYSFTAFLLRELRSHVEKGITVRELAGILLENDRITGAFGKWNIDYLSLTLIISQKPHIT